MLGLVVQSCLTLCNPMDRSPPGSSVHGFLQARILEWIAIPFSRDLPNPGIEPGSPASQADSLPSELPEKPMPINVHPISVEIRDSLSTSLCTNYQLGKSLPPSLLVHFILNVHMQLFTRGLIWASSTQQEACLSPAKPWPCKTLADSRETAVQKGKSSKRTCQQHRSNQERSSTRIHHPV